GIHQRLVIRQRGALDGVAVVEQHRVRELRTRLLDQRGRALEAERLVLCQLEVVVRQHVGVQVGRLQQRQLGRGTSGHGRRTGGSGGVATAATGGQAQRQGNGER